MMTGSLVTLLGVSLDGLAVGSKENVRVKLKEYRLIKAIP